MTVTTQKIKAEISSQTIGCAAGVVDVSEKIIAKGAAKLKQQGLKENYAISLMTQFFKVPDQNGRDSLIKMFSGTKCVTVNADYLTEHFSTDNRIIGKNISNCLVTVVGYSQFPSQGAYVREGGAIYFNTWRPPVEMFNEADFIQFYSDGYGKYLADIDLFLSSAGQVSTPD